MTSANANVQKSALNVVLVRPLPSSTLISVKYTRTDFRSKKGTMTFGEAGKEGESVREVFCTKGL